MSYFLSLFRHGHKTREIVHGENFNHIDACNSLTAFISPICRYISYLKIPYSYKLIAWSIISMSTISILHFKSLNQIIRLYNEQIKFPCNYWAVIYSWIFGGKLFAIIAIRFFFFALFSIDALERSKFFDGDTY